MKNIQSSDTQRKPRFTLPVTIDRKSRRPTLVSYAGALRARNKRFSEIHDALLIANAERCDPPLSTPQELNDLKRIAAWAANKPAGCIRSGVVDEEFGQHITELDHVIQYYPWRRTFGRTCQLVAAYLAERMQTAHKLEAAFATRSIAEAIGYAASTVSRALRALSGRGKPHPDIPILFRWHRPKSLADAPSYSISRNVAKIAHTLLSSTPSVSVCAKIATGETHDAFRGRKGLSKTALLVLRIIEHGNYHTAKEIAAAGNLVRRTVAYTLTILQNEGLIEKKAYWQRTTQTLAIVAEKRGSAGHAKKQRTEHQVDREKWLKALKNGERRRKKDVIRDFYAPAPNFDDLTITDFSRFEETIVGG